MPVSKSARKPLLRWIAGAAAAVTLSLFGAIGVAGPASAAAGDCPSGSTCVWKDSDFASGGWGFYYRGYENGINEFAKYSFGGGQGTVNLNVTSVYNNGNSQKSGLYSKNFFSGFLVDFNIKSGSANLGWANDLARSGGFTFCANNPYNYVCS